MLSAKAFKPDAVIRLLLGLFVCFWLGYLAAGVVRCAESGKATGRFYLVSAAAFVCMVGALGILRRGWALETFMRRFGLWLAFLYGGILLEVWASHLVGAMPAGTVPSAAQMVVNMLSFQGGVLLLTWYFLKQQRLGWTESFGFSEDWLRAIVYGLILAAVFTPLGYLLQGISVRIMELFPSLHLVPEQQMPVQTLQAADSWLKRVILGAVTVLLAPAGEEVLFRGILYPWLKQIGYPRLAVWGTALVFAAMHFHLPSLLPLLVLALALTALYDWTGNLLAPIAAHSLFNAHGLAQLYLSEQMFRVWRMGLLVLLALALLWVVARKRSSQHERV
jgi:membrane protease YdiL (CAAX protease family)